MGVAACLGRHRQRKQALAYPPSLRPHSALVAGSVFLDGGELQQAAPTGASRHPLPPPPPHPTPAGFVWICAQGDAPLHKAYGLAASLWVLENYNWVLESQGLHPTPLTSHCSAMAAAVLHACYWALQFRTLLMPRGLPSSTELLFLLGATRWVARLRSDKLALERCWVACHVAQPVHNLWAAISRPRRLRRRCAACSATSTDVGHKLRCCAACHSAHYCSVACQVRI